MSNTTTNSTLAEESGLLSDRYEYVTKDEYSTAVIIILSVLVCVAILFTLCGLFMKAEAHAKSDTQEGGFSGGGLLFMDSETHFAGLGLNLGESMDV